MTELLSRAIEEMSRLPQPEQDRLARRLLEEVLPNLGSGQKRPETPRQGDGTKLAGLVGLADRAVQTDAHLSALRGPAWSPELDGDP